MRKGLGEFSALASLCLCLFICSRSVFAEEGNWLIPESENTSYPYAVMPVRIDDVRVGGFEVRQVPLYRNGRRIEDYGFTIREQGEAFEFDKSSVERFYLRSSASTWEGTWNCKDGFISARVRGQDSSVGQDYPGIREISPTGTRFETMYVKQVDVLGQTRLQEEMREVEVWGLANSRENAQHMANYFDQRMMQTLRHRIELDIRPSYDFSPIPIRSELLDDSIRGSYAVQVIEEDDRKLRATVEITLTLNGETQTWRKPIRNRRQRDAYGWRWSNPGWVTGELGGQRFGIWVAMTRSVIHVNYPNKYTDEERNLANPRIPRCD